MEVAGGERRREEPRCGPGLFLVPSSDFGCMRGAMTGYVRACVLCVCVCVWGCCVCVLGCCGRAGGLQLTVDLL